jgi:hypothetical protein
VPESSRAEEPALARFPRQSARDDLATLGRGPRPPPWSTSVFWGGRELTPVLTGTFSLDQRC